MNVIFDASALLNLSNGSALDLALLVPDMVARIGPMVQAECKTIASVLDVFILDGRITVLNDEMLPASLFLSLLERYQLGEGETECLAFACQGDDIVCCDDRRARAMITRELGEGRVTGTLGILIRMIHHGLIESQSAIAAYEQMRRQGGFLPEVSVQDLDKAAEFMRD